MTSLNIGQPTTRYRQEIAEYESTEPVRDISGRIVAPPQSIYPERPAGPWTTNTDQRGA